MGGACLFSCESAIVLLVRRDPPCPAVLACQTCLSCPWAAATPATPGSPESTSDE